MKPTDTIALTPGKRVLFLTKDPELIRRQLRGELDLSMKDLKVEDLLDDINTDAMAPAWACFDWRPADIARNAYAGMTIQGERLFPEGSLIAGDFEVIVSGFRKGVGSSRETAVQAEKWSGIRLAVAASFAPIHARNNINQGVLMGDHAVIRRLQAGERIALSEFSQGQDPVTRMIIEYGGLFAFTKAYARGEVSLQKPAHAARPMTLAEKILASHLVGSGKVFVQPGDAVCVRVDGGYSHEFTTAQVHAFLDEEYGSEYKVANPAKFAVFEDHLIYADGVQQMARFSPKIQILRDMQRTFQSKTGVQDFSAQNGVSPGICHTIARERIIDIASTQFPDGSAYHQYQPLTKRGNNDVGSGFNDDPLWLIFGVAAYIRETGDYGILDEQVPFDNDPKTKTSLFEHLKRSFNYTLNNLGPHGLPLIGRADWNDCLNLNCFSEMLP